MKQNAHSDRPASTHSFPSVRPATTVPTTSEIPFPTTTHPFNTTQSTYPPSTSTTESSTPPYAHVASYSSTLHGSPPRPTWVSHGSRRRNEYSHSQYSLFPSKSNPIPKSVPANSTSGTENPKSGLSIGTTVGLGAALGLVILALVGICLLWLHRRRIRSADVAPSLWDEKEVPTPCHTEVATADESRKQQLGLNGGNSSNVQGPGPAELTPTPIQTEWRELGDTSVKHQLQSRSLYELDCS